MGEPPIPRPPQLAALLEHCEPERLESDVVWADVELSDLQLPNQHAKGAAFNSARLTPA